MRQTISITIKHSVVAYDRFSSLLPPYQPAEITPIEQLVEQKLEALVAEVTGGERETDSDIRAS